MSLFRLTPFHNKYGVKFWVEVQEVISTSIYTWVFIVVTSNYWTTISCICNVHVHHMYACTHYYRCSTCSYVKYSSISHYLMPRSHAQCSKVCNLLSVIWLIMNIFVHKVKTKCACESSSFREQYLYIVHTQPVRLIDVIPYFFAIVKMGQGPKQCKPSLVSNLECKCFWLKFFMSA